MDYKERFFEEGEWERAEENFSYLYETSKKFEDSIVEKLATYCLSAKREITDNQLWELLDSVFPVAAPSGFYVSEFEDFIRVFSKTGLEEEIYNLLDAMVSLRKSVSFLIEEFGEEGTKDEFIEYKAIEVD